MFGRNDHVKVVKTIAEGLKAAGKLQRYLELGIKKGACFNVVAPLAEVSFAVDINNCDKYIKDYKRYPRAWCSTDIFFENLHKDVMFDLVFIDADHSHEASFKDFKNVYPHVNEGGFILLHDTYPPTPEYAVPGYCHDTYKTPYKIKKLYYVEMVTLPFYYGITIIKK